MATYLSVPVDVQWYGLLRLPLLVEANPYDLLPTTVASELVSVRCKASSISVGAVDCDATRHRDSTMLVGTRVTATIRQTS